jgi:hypothetical protein
LGDCFLWTDFKKLEKSNPWAIFSHETSCVGINFDKKGLGYTYGDFFTNSSGHPARFAARLTCIRQGLRRTLPMRPERKLGLRKQLGQIGRGWGGS